MKQFIFFSCLILLFSCENNREDLLDVVPENANFSYRVTPDEALLMATDFVNGFSRTRSTGLYPEIKSVDVLKSTIGKETRSGYGNFGHNSVCRKSE